MLWVLVCGAAAVLFVAGVAWAGLWLGRRIFGDGVGATLMLPVSLVVAMLLWTQVVLGLIWRVRRAALRRSGSVTTGTVAESSYRRLNRVNGFDQHRVRIEVTFVHPATGVDVRQHKDYVYSEFFRARATELRDRIPAGTTVPMLVHGHSAAFDIPERPAWADIW